MLDNPQCVTRPMSCVMCHRSCVMSNNFYYLHFSDILASEFPFDCCQAAVWACTLIRVSTVHIQRAVTISEEKKTNFLYVWAYSLLWLSNNKQSAQEAHQTFWIDTHKGYSKKISNFDVIMLRHTLLIQFLRGVSSLQEGREEIQLFFTVVILPTIRKLSNSLLSLDSINQYLPYFGVVRWKTSCLLAQPPFLTG